MVSNDKIIQLEKEAKLLVNPRPTNEEYTKYSFPSKIMEYMASGTPVLTTRLLGMPKEYYDYIYCFEDEKVDGIEKKLIEILSKEQKELTKMGNKAKEFVLMKKNNKVQAEKIINFLGE